MCALRCPVGLERAGVTRNKLLLVGATGSLGQSIDGHLQDIWSISRISRNIDTSHGIPVDCSNEARLSAVLDELQPDAIVNTAALTDVDACELNPEIAERHNVTICQHLADWARRYGTDTRIVHISSDQVYSGRGPHTEGDASPINVYGRTKLEGERAVLKHENTVVLRTNFFGIGPAWKSGFVDWILTSLKQKRNITLFDDILFNPLFAPTLVDIISQILQADVTGVFNAGAKDGLSKAAFARQLANLFGLSADNARNGSSAGATRPAARPQDMRMNVGRIERDLGISCPRIEDELTALLRNARKLGEEFIS